MAASVFVGAVFILVFFVGIKTFGKKMWQDILNHRF